MELKTRYDIGDKVYLIENTRIIIAKIIDIQISVSDVSGEYNFIHGTKLKYLYKDVVRYNLEWSGGSISRYEYELFESKEELLNYLMNE